MGVGEIKLQRYNFRSAHILLAESDDGNLVRHEDVAALEAENESLRCRLEKAEGLLEGWYENSDIPEKNCSCDRNPPCGDCVAWGGIRDVDEDTKRFLGERV